MTGRYAALAVLSTTLFVTGCGTAPTPPATATTGAGALDRTVLPIPEPVDPTITAMDARDATAPRRFDVKAPANAPNVVIILIDDMGFGASSTFGGPVNMP